MIVMQRMKIIFFVHNLKGVGLDIMFLAKKIQICCKVLNRKSQHAESFRWDKISNIINMVAQYLHICSFIISYFVVNI